jgi:predicted  nucleic acid-binding Zn-ribbon protein
MASPDLRRLWKLHLVDVAIQDIRNKAAHMDVGKKLESDLNALAARLAEHPYKKYHVEQQDLELQQKSIDDKIAKFEKELYGGKIVNPREVENYQKEIGILKNQRAQMDERLIEIWDAMPPLKSEADQIETSIEAKKKELGETVQRARQLKSQLEAEFKSKSAQRPELAKDQNPTLLAKYEAIRKNHHGIGMAEVVKKRQCGACGTLLPERTLQACLDDKTVTCETCHRILYYTEGVV